MRKSVRFILYVIILGCAIFTGAYVGGFLGEQSTDVNNYKNLSRVKTQNGYDGNNWKVSECFSYNGDFDKKAFVELCRRKKKVTDNSMTYTAYSMVVFDDPSVAIYAGNPIDGEYSQDVEKHIKAFFNYRMQSHRGRTPESITLYMFEKSAADSVPVMLNLKK
ncbi:MAG: hypothetical protein II973_03105 [Spirochaetaceae bacterium]|nr:hypothetical protein [Spirochaetaceae bacterium]